MINLNYFKPKTQKKFDLVRSREKFKKRKSKNLKFLLEKRFLWMNEFIKGKKVIIELGSGNGASKDILNNKNIILTDIQKYPWISKKIDMNNLKLKKKYIKNVDVFILNQALHHCANPTKLLKKMLSYLKKDGYVLIREPEISFSLRLFSSPLDWASPSQGVPRPQRCLPGRPQASFPEAKSAPDCREKHLGGI